MASESTGEEVALVSDHQINQSVAQSESLFHRLGESSPFAIDQLHSIENDFNGVALVSRKDNLIRQMENLAIDTNSLETLLPQIVQFLPVLPLALQHDRSAYRDLFTGMVMPCMKNDLFATATFDQSTTARTMGSSQPGIQQAHESENFRDGSHR